MAPVNTGYSEEVNNFKDGILDILRKTKVPAQNFVEFEEWIRSLWKAVQFENFIFSFRNSLVAEAYSKLCAEFNTWEWTFKKHMIDWYTKSETKIFNMGALSVQSMNAPNIDDILVNLKHEFAHELDKEEKIIFDKIQQYFESEEEHVHLVENHKEDFINSARGLRRETETDLRNKLENAVLIQKEIKKVELIKQNQRDTMKAEVLKLISVFRNSKNSLSESQLNEEFEKLWDDIVKQYSFTALPRQDVVKEIYRLLHNNLETKGRAVREMLLNVTSLDQCGIGSFFAKDETENRIQTLAHSLPPEQRDRRNNLIQIACEKIANDCGTFISSKTSAKSDYNSADIQELLCLIDKQLENCQDPQISPEIEASLKIHICGIAARSFQKMHDDYTERNDPLKSLERFKDQWLADFKDLYYQQDQCQKKAEMCAMKCFAPAVMEYIQKHLGPDIVEEIRTDEGGIDFRTRSFFQFSLLKHLLQDDDFNHISAYVENYEKQDVVKETYRLLNSNLEMKGGAIREMLSNIPSLDQCGIGPFYAKAETESIFQKFKHSFRPELRDNKNMFTQQACESIINESERIIARKTTAKSDYNIAEIQELLCFIDKTLASYKDLQISPENEAALKIHICGKAARAFQKMHDNYIQSNDPLKFLERFRKQWLSDFKDLYYQRDQCQNKAETCAMKCFAPAVMEYIQKRLGPDIVEEMLTGERAVDFSTRSFFQFALLKQLLQDDDFNSILGYVDNYEKFVTEWISEKIIEHFSKKDAFLKLEMKHLNTIVSKLKTAIESAKSITNNSCNFATSVFTCLDKELVIPIDTLSGTLALNNSDPAEFADCLKSSIEKMHKTLENQLRSVRDVKTKLTRLLVNRPQEVLFSRVFGCGKMCPFCSAPCEAGGKDHAEHFASIHRPEEPLPPENLQIKNEASSVYLKWTDPMTDDEIPHRFRHLENGNILRQISNGLVEMSWYLPGGQQSNDKFKEPVAVANLRGDISVFKAQFAFLNQISSAVFLFCDDVDSDQTFLDSLQIRSKLVLVRTTDSATSGHNLTQKFKPYSEILRDRNMNDFKFVETLQEAVVDILADSTKMSIEKMSKIAPDLGILVDENNTVCQNAKKRAALITQDIKNIPEYKKKELSLQDKVWKEISKLEKEMCRLKAKKQNIEHYKSELKSQIQKLQKQQGSNDASKVSAQNFLEFEEWIRSLWKAVQFENFIFSFRNTLVAEAYSKLCVEYNKWEWAFRKYMIGWYTRSETKITNMGVRARAKSDYSADIQELLCFIDKKLEDGKNIEISPEIEASLKIHICGNATRAFQKMHDDYIQRNDPMKSLEKFKEQWLADFKDLYYQRDQCQKKAEACAMTCIAPAVMEYIQKHLGPDIVDEMLTGEKAFAFSTRTFFQCSLLKELLQDDDFNNICDYVQNYEQFVTEWISEKIIEHFSKEDAFLKLEMKHLNAIVSKLKAAIESAKSITNNSCSFMTNVFTCLDKELVIPVDTLSGTLALNNSDPAEFADCLKSSIEKMQKTLADQLRSAGGVEAKLSTLSVNRPQEELFSRVFGCGKKCPFCSAPCEAGGKDHTEHFASVHRPQGIGYYRWIETNKLIPDICSSLVASENRFRCEDTGQEWYPYKEYRQFYPNWRIQPDNTIEATDFWKYIFTKYNTKFAKTYNLNPADIPDDWHYISVHQANKCLDDTFLLKSHKNDDPFL
ncbi:interferon-induced very large GTPase 1-like protein [Labeo rohita]|uniref:Interferon-induced very large GTPase 1-like protein n=1 Tax=Labeo rohita TaxID=84645 RepID=A0A498M6B1_LABRO|nr:interferon-induced very large GTPase 1-like protein [Labeo rohita]